MGNLVNYTSCPVCDAKSVFKIITAKDYTVSNEMFEIFQCANCQLRFTQNVPDADSIGKYYLSENYISHTNTSKGIVNRIYQLVRKRATNQKRKLIEKIANISKGDLLDVGSGTGFFASEMKDAGWKVQGLEPDKGARKIAEEVNNIILSPTEKLFELPANNFDAITLWHVLEHVHELKKYIAQFRNLLKENGRLFIAVPNYTSYDAEVYKECWAAYDVPRHLYHFAPNAMNHLIKDAGLKVVDIKPMWFDSYYVSLLSSKYKNGSTKWINAFLTGLRSNLKAKKNVEKCSSIIYIISK